MYTKQLLSLLILLFFSTAAYGQIRINEVGYAGVDFQGAGKWVELYNSGDTEIDISGHWLCNFPSYDPISGLTILEGSTTVPAGGFVVIAWDPIGTNDGELGLYTSNSFGDFNALVDYMQYGSSGHQRESVADSADVWDSGAFVTAAASGESLAHTDKGGAPLDDWAAATATPGVSNDAPINIRINEIGYAGVDFQGAAKWVELYNAGDADVDISEFWLCNFPSYDPISGLTILEGSTTVPAGGFVVIAWDPIGVDDGELGLYTSNSFGDSNAMVDYMQYGSAGHQREAVADTADVWDVGAFAASADNGSTLSFFDNGGALVDNWAFGMPTAGAQNESQEVTSNENDFDLPGAFTLKGHYPEPFNPSTTILFDLTEPAEVAVVVYNLLGRQMMSLSNLTFQAGADQTLLLDAAQLPSGIYLYRVIAKGISQTVTQSGRMTLLK